MKLDDRYVVNVVIIEGFEGGLTGDCYDDFSKFKKEHPYSTYRFGFIVYDTKTGFIPDGCNDWNDSPEEAIFDYFDNISGV